MNRKNIIKNNEVSKLVTYSLGGYEQKVMLEGKKRSNPVVIMLHGGPGSPIPFSAGCRGLFPEITDKLLMVAWDQLGCGINNYPIDDSFHIDHFVTMTVDLVREVRKEFPDNRVFLFGMSWGSILAAKTAHRVPELLDGVVTYGQVLHHLIFNDEVYHILENAGLSVKEMTELSEMKTSTSHSYEENVRMVKWIQKYTEGYQCRQGGKAPVLPVVWGMLTSPDYSLKDFQAVVVNGYRGNRSLSQEMEALDLRDTLRQIKIPYLILQGNTDIVTSTKSMQEFFADNSFDGRENPNLTLKIVPDSGHMPGGNAMNIIIDEIENQCFGMER